MSIVQALLGSIASSTSGGGGGGGGATYPSPGSGTYQANIGGGFSNYGTAYDPGGAVDAIYSASQGWRRVTSLGYWCSVGSQNNGNPGVFGQEYAATVDAYGGFGSTEGADAFAMEWKGYFQASTAASYWNFIIDSDDVAMFWIGNAALNPTLENAYSISNNGTTYPTNSLLLTEGKYYPIRMRFQEWSGAERCQIFAAAEGGTANSMLPYFNAARLIYSSYTNGYSSQGSPILNLGNATTNVYSGSGNWIDSSQAKNDAIMTGNAPTWLPADSGGVFELDGTNYFEVPNLRYYNDQEMTVSIWFNIPADVGEAQTLISKELTFKIRINQGGALQVFAGNGGGWNIQPVISGAYTYGEWTNITVTVTSGNTHIYKNGQSIGVGTGVVLWSGDTQAFNIGTYSSGAGDFMTGKVGEVKYYTGFKSAQDVLDEYTATAARYGLTP